MKYFVAPWLLLAWNISSTWARFVASSEPLIGEVLVDGSIPTSTNNQGLFACKNGAVQVVEWLDEDGEDSTPRDEAKEGVESIKEPQVATRRVARVFEALSALEWPCPVLVRGRVLRDTIPAKEWHSSSYLQAKCAPGGDSGISLGTSTIAIEARSTASGSAGSIPPMVDISQDPVFTYEDSNMVLAKRIVERGHGFTTHSRVVISQLKADKAQSKNTRKKKGSKSTKKSISRLAGSDSSTESTFNTSDFLRALHRNANQTSPSRFVRYGGKARASPCPHLARDAAPDYGEDPSLWLGSAGVISSAHFDLFDNFFCLVAGSKTLVVAPPSPENLHRFAPYPGSHPHARQMQKHFNASGDKLLPWPSSYRNFGQTDSIIKTEESERNRGNSGSSSSSCENGVDTCTNCHSSFKDTTSPPSRATARESASVDGAVAVEVRAGEALWVPAGWVHHVTTSLEPEEAAHPCPKSSVSGSVGDVDNDDDDPAGSTAGIGNRSDNDGGRDSVNGSGFTAALSINRNAPELERFNRWLSVDGALPLPQRPPPPASARGSSTVAPPNANTWSLLRVAAFLQVFLPELLNVLHEADVDKVDDGRGIDSSGADDRNAHSSSKTSSGHSRSSRSTSGSRHRKSSGSASVDGSTLASSQSLPALADSYWPLALLVRQSYSAEVRRHLGIAAALTEPFPCARLSGAAHPEDAAAAIAAAVTAAARLKRDFRPPLRRLFLQPYLETVLSKLGGGGGPNVRNPFVIGLGFAEWCLLTPRLGPPDANIL